MRHPRCPSNSGKLAALLSKKNKTLYLQFVRAMPRHRRGGRALTCTVLTVCLALAGGEGGGWEHSSAERVNPAEEKVSTGGDARKGGAAAVLVY